MNTTYLEQLTILRKRHNISQQELGEKLGISHAAISDMEKGKTKITIGRLFEWTEALRVGLDISFIDKNY